MKQNKIEKNKPKLLLHSCCAPCSSACIERLAQNYEVSVFYYNPNILPESEYEKRKQEQIRFLEEVSIPFFEGEYNPKDFKLAIKGKEELPEKSERCYCCYKFRMKKTCEFAKENGFEYFTTTLSVSPHKNSAWILEIGKNLEKENGGVKFLAEDFKKQDGYRRSLELSKQYNFYRQAYCGCGVKT